MTAPGRAQAMLAARAKASHDKRQRVLAAERRGVACGVAGERADRADGLLLALEADLLWPIVVVTDTWSMSSLSTSTGTARGVPLGVGMAQRVQGDQQVRRSAPWSTARAGSPSCCTCPAGCTPPRQSGTRWCRPWRCCPRSCAGR